jgi:hypothetical protein
MKTVVGMLTTKRMLTGEEKVVNNQKTKKNQSERKIGMIIIQKSPSKTSGKESKLILGSFNRSLYINGSLLLSIFSNFSSVIIKCTQVVFAFQAHKL